MKRFFARLVLGVAMLCPAVADAQQAASTGTSAHSAAGKVIEVLSVTRSDDLPMSPGIGLPGSYFLNVTFRSDDPAFKPTGFPRESCGKIEATGIEFSALGTGMRTGPAASFNCVFAIPTKSGPPFKWKVPGYEPMELAPK